MYGEMVETKQNNKKSIQKHNQKIFATTRQPYCELTYFFKTKFSNISMTALFALFTVHFGITPIGFW